VGKDEHQQGRVETPSACARALSVALAGQVLLPGEPGYARARGGLFSAEASLRRPLCIVQPAGTAQVATALKIARDFGCPVTARGGGLSPLCAGDQAVMIDLSAHLGGGTLVGCDARMGGGATMGALLELLAPQSRLVPVGVAPLPGMGLALRGGVGHLTRSAGLTLDHIREVEIVAPSGEVLTLSGQSRGGEADLWWAVRGAGPHFGVVTSVTFRSRPAPPRLFAQRLVLTLDALPAYLDLATELPRDISASSALGPPAGEPGAPVLFVYLVCAGCGGAGVSRVQELTRRLTEAGGAKPLFESADTYPYPRLPPYEIPALDGKAAGAAGDLRWGGPPAAPQAERRLFKYEKCPFLGPLDAQAAAGLVDVIRAAPTPSCRIDLQHGGGALGDVAATATAFWNRSFEWNCPVIGAWVGPDGEREACTSWAKQALRVLAPYTVGAYSVEIVPGLPETANEVEQAYGGNLPRLRELKKRWDPDNLFGLYYPL
jgi:hypothetical protein